MATLALPLDAAERARPRAIAVWLFAVAAIVFVMVVVGGITRLTESGLSIVRWDPVGGIVPPLSPAGWAAEYAAYRTSPQGVLVNADMGVAAFKHIFFWEWLHRVVARVFVAALVGGLAWFAWRRQVPRGYGTNLVVLLALGATEPVVGWWMVASGLVDRPSVAPERLAFHLIVALSILALSMWTALSLYPSPSGEGRETAQPARGWAPPADRGPSLIPPPRAAASAASLALPLKVRGRPTRWILPFAALLYVQILWGALTAGLHAGHAADTWPLMLGHFVPPLASVVADPVSVQFIHRTLAYAVAASALAVAFATFRAGAGARAAALASLVVVQFALGVLTVVHKVPLALAAAHQATAALLVAAAIWTAHWTLRPPRTSLAVT